MLLWCLDCTAASQRPDAPQPAAADDEEEARVEEEEEFDHFQDEEEFEGLDQERQPSRPQGDKPHLTIAKVCTHLNPSALKTPISTFSFTVFAQCFSSPTSGSFDSWLMLAGLTVYFGNFMAGRNKNHRLATGLVPKPPSAAARQLLPSLAFHASAPWTARLSSSSVYSSDPRLGIRDDGRKELAPDEAEAGGLVKDSESVYTLWCSGRLCVEGMLVELRLLKRQDLLSLIAQMVRPSADQLVIRVTMSPQSMDGFVMCLATKKTAARLHKTMADLSTYCPEKKRPDKYGLPANFTVLSEMGEVANAMVDQKVLSVIKRYEECIDYIHMSDQYSGPRLQECATAVPSCAKSMKFVEIGYTTTKLPEVKKGSIGFNVITNMPYYPTLCLYIWLRAVPGMGRVSAETMEEMKPLLQLVFYCIDKVRRFKLSKE
ncbi:PAT complex subunit CCDC47-like, partial [Dermacentor silvarum]|uniref:PAT complex subunit CCDC47-like n=1 Tax=Dermacentor silvarum TaxID=543639 RepID=UPI0021015078